MSYQIHNISPITFRNSCFFSHWFAIDNYRDSISNVFFVFYSMVLSYLIRNTLPFPWTFRSSHIFSADITLRPWKLWRGPTHTRKSMIRERVCVCVPRDLHPRQFAARDSFSVGAWACIYSRVVSIESSVSDARRPDEKCISISKTKTGA